MNIHRSPLNIQGSTWFNQAVMLLNNEAGSNSVCSFNHVRLKLQTQAGNNAGPISVSSFNRVC